MTTPCAKKLSLSQTFSYVRYRKVTGNDKKVSRLIVRHKIPDSLSRNHDECTEGTTNLITEQGKTFITKISGDTAPPNYPNDVPGRPLVHKQSSMFFLVHPEKETHLARTGAAIPATGTGPITWIPRLDPDITASLFC
jgi:hypothetical protein